MFFGTVIRRCLLPAAAVVAESKFSSSKDADKAGNICRPSELPIYTPDPPPIHSTADGEQEQAPNFIENSFRSVRQTWEKYSVELVAYEKVAKESFNESKQNVEWLVDYLRQEDNTLPKAGAIGIGALTGLIFGLRGGFFKRTIYASTGALGMAAVCYPKEASEYTQLGVTEGKKYLTIAYNFIYGDEQSKAPEQVNSTASVSKENVQKVALNPSQDTRSDNQVLTLVNSPHECPAVDPERQSFRDSPVLDTESKK